MCEDKWYMCTSLHTSWLICGDQLSPATMDSRFWTQVAWLMR